MKESISFIGLGKMGLPMARHLLEGGYPLYVYNRSKEKAEPLLKEGASLLDSPKEALQKASIVVTMLSNDQAIEEVVYGKQGLSETLKEGDIHLSMSTISPDISRRLEDFHLEKKAYYVAAPVLGRPEVAQNRKLWIVTAGAQEAKQRVAPLLHLIGQGVFDFGEKAYRANSVKLLCNFLIFTAMEALAETITLARKNDIDDSQLWSLISQTLFACPTYQNYGPLIIHPQKDKGDFQTSLAFKDVSLLLNMAAESQTPMPFASFMSERFLTNLAQGREKWDVYFALAKSIQESAGLTESDRLK